MDEFPYNPESFELVMRLGIISNSRLPKKLKRGM